MSELPEDVRRPTALISWAHQDADWDAATTRDRRDDVLRLAQGLRESGIDCDVDAYHPNEDWTRWGPRRVMAVDVVLVVVSAAWRHGWEGTGDPSRNVGAGAEASALKSLEAREGRDALQQRCRLILLPGSTDNDIPAGMHGLQRYRLNAISPADLEPLLRDLTNQPHVAIPPLGTVPVLPPSLGPAAHTQNEIRSKLAALPEVGPHDRPEVPWVEFRRALEAQLAETAHGPNVRAPRHGVRWVTLAEPAPVAWRGGSQVRNTGDGAVVVIHAVPVPARRLSRRLLDTFADVLVGELRSAGLVRGVEGLDVSREPDALIVTRPTKPRRWDEVRRAEFGGCRIGADGQVSTWFTLARDSSGSVLDEDEVSRDVTRGLRLIHTVAAAVNGVEMYAIGVELDDTTLLTDGTLADLGRRTSATMRGFSGRVSRVPAEEAVPVDDLNEEGAAEVAVTLTRLLIDDWQRQ